MIRREFLIRTLSAAVASFFTRNVFARHSMHGMHDMSGMKDMEGMPGMSLMHAAAKRAAQSAPKLAPETAMPAGAPLAALRKLPNESREPGVFRATLVAQPARRQLLPDRSTALWVYGEAAQGPIVGPLIDVREGDTVEIRFVAACSTSRAKG